LTFWLTRKLAGVDALCEYYQELGMDVSILPDDSSEAVEKGLIRQDRGYIKVTGRNFDLVTIRTKGKSTSTSTPISAKQTIPFEYHHIVRTNIADEEALKAKLKKQKKSFLSKEITGISWEGGRLATTLNSDSGLNASIMNFITSDDNLWVEPDKKNNIVRIIFSRPSEMKGGLLQGFKFDRNLVPKDAVDVIDKIAGLTR
jgi:hypothetical protein